jgi:small subunit ribosomal protein S13
MVRIAGVDLLKKKRIEYALTSIYGIGLSTSHKILEIGQINIDTKVSNLTNTQIILLRKIIANNYKIEADLRRSIKQDILRLSQINCFKGQRHRLSLPLRGQRTRTNSRTRRLRKRKK